jgi:phosphate transport system substrate-binding protein
VKAKSTLVGLLGALVIGAFTVGSSTAMAGDISGAGATFPYPIYSKWADAYKTKTGIGLNYQSIGSGGGIKQITNKTVTFGASDMPLKPEKLKEIGVIQWPMIIGGVIPVANIPGVKPGELTIDGKTLAAIYMGEIKKWNDPALKALNPSANLPNMAIAPVHRSDGSGTTFLFSTYLSNTSPAWAEKVGANTSIDWPAGIGAKGNEGVASMTTQTPGGIGYVEYAYVVQNHMTYMKMINKDGAVVSPTAEAFQAAAANADWKNAPGFYLLLTNQPGKASWPIVGASFILMYKSPTDPKASQTALDFFNWAYHNGQEMAKSLDYVPIPMEVVKLVNDEWSMIKR